MYLQSRSLPNHHLNHELNPSTISCIQWLPFGQRCTPQGSHWTCNPWNKRPNKQRASFPWCQWNQPCDVIRSPTRKLNPRMDEHFFQPKTFLHFTKGGVAPSHVWRYTTQIVGPGEVLAWSRTKWLWIHFHDHIFYISILYPRMPTNTVFFEIINKHLDDLSSLTTAKTPINLLRNEVCLCWRYESITIAQPTSADLYRLPGDGKTTLFHFTQLESLQGSGKCHEEGDGNIYFIKMVDMHINIESTVRIYIDRFNIESI